MSENHFYLNNSADPDEMQHYASFHLCPHHLIVSLFKSLPYKRVKCFAEYFISIFSFVWYQTGERRARTWVSIKEKK